MVSALRPWQVSVLFHVVPAAAVALLVLITPQQRNWLEVPVEVVAPPPLAELKEIEKKPDIALKSVNTPANPAAPVRPVFGANRNSLTDSDQGTVEAKAGNTVAKESDNTVLRAEDADALPTPTDEFLVSEMPRVLNEVRPEYPAEAKAKRIEGAVVAQLLIDAAGAVRKVDILEGPEMFRASSLEALKKFRFRPAQVNGQPVAVQIRYTLRFKLEL